MYFYFVLGSLSKYFLSSELWYEFLAAQQLYGN